MRRNKRYASTIATATGALFISAGLLAGVGVSGADASGALERDGLSMAYVYDWMNKPTCFATPSIDSMAIQRQATYSKKAIKLTRQSTKPVAVTSSLKRYRAYDATLKALPAGSTVTLTGSNLQCLTYKTGKQLLVGGMWAGVADADYTVTSSASKKLVLKSKKRAFFPDLISAKRLAKTTTVKKGAKFTGTDKFQLFKGNSPAYDYTYTFTVTITR